QREWIPATKSEPCPACGAKGWCERSADGEVVVCMKGDGSPYNGIVAEKRTNKAGSPMFVYRLTSRDSAVAVPTIGSSTQKGDPDSTDRAYRRLIAECQRDKAAARRHLAARGLPVETCEQLIAQGFCELPTRGRHQIAKTLFDAGLERDMSVTPGFCIRERDGKQFWSINGYAGFLIPVRDLQQRIVGMQVRLSDETRAKLSEAPKYVWLSSRSCGGPPSGAPIHVPVFDGDRSIIRVTEGALKATIATCIGGILTIATAGTATNGVADLVRAIEPREVRLAYDPEFTSNCHVYAAVESLIADLEGLPIDLVVEVWPLKKGKGIDDLLLAGHKPDCISPGEFVKRFKGKAQNNNGQTGGLRLERILDTSLRLLDDAEDQPSLLSTGLPELDQKLGGGIAKGERIVIGGRPNHGKSALGQHVLSALAEQGQRCLFVSCEMTDRQVAKRSIMRATNVHNEQWLAKRDQVSDDIRAEYEGDANYTVVFDIVKLDDIVRLIRTLAKDGLDAVLLDYLQLVDAPGRGEFEKVSSTSRTLTGLAKALGITLVMLAQLNRAVEKRANSNGKRKKSDEFDLMPQLSDLRGSGQIEQDCDTAVFCVYPAKVDPTFSKSLFVLRVAKCRDRDADSSPFAIEFETGRMRFHDRLSPQPAQRFAEFDAFNEESF
ncbi:MAG: AAA family ATPase, partial [Planctomycetes bacterium]|nr:AAA family ATPase [Planctomycetota bacterium]